MARVLTSTALSKIAEAYGTEPISIIEIEWNDGTLSRYADRDVAGYAEGKIANIDSVDEIIKVDGGNGTSQVGFTLNDTDGTIKALLDKYDIHKRPCTIKQFYGDTGFLNTDAFAIFTGQIVSPTVWNEHERTVSFTVLSQIYSKEAGFSPEEGQFRDVSNELIGQTWPMCFGGVLNVPAVKSSQTLEGTAIQAFGVPDATLPLKKKFINLVLTSMQTTFNKYVEILSSIEYKQFQIRFVGRTPKSKPAGTLKIRLNGVESTLLKATDSFFEDLIVKKKAIPEADLQVLYESNYKGPGIVLGTYEFPNKTYPVEISQQTSGSGVFLLESVYNPGNIKRTYAYSIVDFDLVSQAREDWAIKLDQYNQIINSMRKKFQEEYAGLEDTDPNKITFIADVLKFEKLRQGLIDDLKAKDAYLKELEYNFDQIKTDVDNIQMLFNFQGDIRKRIQALNVEYLNVKAELQTILRLEADERYKAKKTVIVNGGERFPQTDDTDNPNKFTFSCHDVTFKGYMEGRKLTILETTAKYKDIELKEREEIEKDDWKYIWLEDENLNLEGYYLWCDNGIITKVSSQIDNKLEINLAEIPQRSSRFRKSLFRDSPQVVKKLRGMLDGSLVGDETDEDILNIAMYMPTDLSKQVQTILNGGLDDKFAIDTYVLDFYGDVDFNSGYYAIKYGEFETNPIPAASNADTVKSYLKLLPQFVKEPKFNDYVEVKPLEGRFGFTIKFSQELLPLYEMSIDSTYLSSPVKVQYINLVSNKVNSFYVCIGDPTLTKSQDNAIFLSRSNTPAQIQTKLEAKLGKTIKVEGSPLGSGSVKISHFRKRTEDVADYIVRFHSYPASVVTTPEETLVTVSPFETTKLAFVSVRVLITGAHEYTRKQIIAKLEDSHSYKENSKQLKDLEKRINTVLSSYKSGDLDPDEYRELRQQLSEDIDKYVNIFKKAGYYSVSSEISKQISNEEFKLLMKLEVLDFLNLYRSLQPMIVEPENPITKYYFSGRDITTIKEASKIILPHWLKNAENRSPEDVFDITMSLPDSTPFYAQIGDQIVYEGNYQEKFICNIMPSTIKAVYGERTIDGVKKLVPIPSSYYTKNESDNYGYYTCTSISFKRPLREYIDENWSEKIYVSLISSVGPDMSDIIKWIAQKYTDLTIDEDNFADIKTKLANYPCNFALLEKKDSLTLIEEIAWQSRCLAYTANKVLKITYLSEEPETVKTLTLTDIENNSLKLTYSETEEVVTKFVAIWQPDYYYPENKVVLRYNVNKYNELQRDYQFYIYNNRDLVLKSATFWLTRKANTWKILEFSTFISNLDLQTYDPVLLDTGKTYVSNSAVKCLIESCNYNSDSLTISLRLWVPVRAGEMEPYKFAWPANLTVQDIFPTVEDVLSGAAGNYVNSQVPNGVSYDPQSDDPEFRPKDYGTKVPADTFDSFPASSISDLEEFDYKEYKNTGYKLPDYLRDPTKPSDKTMDPKNPPIDDVRPSSGAATIVQAVQPFIGTVVDFDSEVDEQPEEGLANIPAVKQYYKVQSPSGAIFKVRQVLCAAGDRIPYGTPAMVVYEQALGEYQMQVPVWSTPPIAGIDKDLGTTQS